MSEFLTFMGWVVVVFIIFVLVVGFNRQMMEKNRIRDEITAARKAAKDKKQKIDGDSNENVN
ncbi:MAG: hypothetical protein SOW11_02690 [Campylobacter lanienae]|nr:MULTISPECIES: hypothetical protein [unclassified Campylobacter]MDY3132887.1 hypothetical protein [Campylobacter lanienae]